VLDGETHGNMKPGQMSQEIENAINGAGTVEPAMHTAVSEVMPQ
jgi:hypothetical protein